VTKADCIVKEWLAHGAGLPCTFCVCLPISSKDYKELLTEREGECEAIATL
jgi:hypothetical protein